MMIHMKSVVVAKWQGYFTSQLTTSLSDRSSSIMQNATPTTAALRLGIIPLVVVFSFPCEVHGSILP